MTSNQLFIDKKPLKLFFTAAIPGSISMLASSLYALFEAIFIGKFVGETAFAAINLAFPFIIINFSLADLIGVGSSVPIAIALGRQDSQQANNTFTCAVLMNIGTGFLMGITMYFIAPLLISFVGADGELATLAVQYIRIYALWSPVTTIVFATDNYLRISGKIRGSMFLNIFMSLLTLVLDFLFIIVFRWGIIGAGMAACLGMFVSAIIAIMPFMRGKMQLRFCKPKFTFGLIRQIVVNGSPAFLSNIAGRLTAIVMNFALLKFGGQSAVAMYGVLMYSTELVYMIMYGVCDSLQPAIGYNLGAGEKKRVISLAKCCYVASAIVSLLATALFYFFPTHIAELFLDKSTSLSSVDANAVKFLCIVFLIRWFSFATQSFLTAIDKPLPATILSVSNALIFPIILIALLWELKLLGLWLNCGITAWLVAILAFILLITTTKNMFRQTSPHPIENQQ